MSGFERDVEHAGHEVHDGPEVHAGPEVQGGPEVHDGPEVEPQEEVYIPSFEYISNGCHLHNEGPPTDDEDEEMDHFTSLAHMCRDEQLFTSYYESIFQQQHASQESENVDQPGDGEDQPGSGEKRRRKYSPYVEKRNMTDNPLFEEEFVDELQDIDHLKDLEGLKKRGIKFTPFKLMPNELPLWKPGDVFKHKDFFYDVLRHTQ